MEKPAKNGIIYQFGEFRLDAAGVSQLEIRTTRVLARLGPLGFAVAEEDQSVVV